MRVHYSRLHEQDLFGHRPCLYLVLETRSLSSAFGSRGLPAKEQRYPGRASHRCAARTAFRAHAWVEVRARRERQVVHPGHVFRSGPLLMQRK